MLSRFSPLAWGLVILNLAPTPWVATGLATGALIGLSSCATKSIDESDPGQLYQDAEDEIKSDHYQIAIEKLRAVKNKFPYSKYSLDAQLRIGDVLFMQEAYAEAASSYETFRDLHPKHEKVAYAMFRAGKSYFLDIPDPISRDLLPAQKSLDAYNEFIRRFPADANAEEARKDVATVRHTLAQKELYIGDFYYKRDFLESAKPRYQKILNLYPETDIAKDAQERIAKIDKRMVDNPGNRQKVKGAESK